MIETDNPVRPILVRTAIGDAYGAAFEFTRKPARANDLRGFAPHPKSMQTGYTDDTLRSMANAHVLLSADDHDPYRADRYAETYLAIHRHDPRDGWSKRFKKMLELHDQGTGAEFMMALERRPTNGCLMGVAVLGLLPDARQVRLATTMQTVSTHSASAVPYAQAVSLAAHHLLEGGSIGSTLEYCLASVEWSSDRQRAAFARLASNDPPNPEMASETVAAAALWGIAAWESTSNLLQWACSSGRDTDSLAAVCMALSACTDEIRDDLPETLTLGIDDFEDMEGLRRLDIRLARKFGKGK